MISLFSALIVEMIHFYSIIILIVKNIDNQYQVYFNTLSIYKNLDKCKINILNIRRSIYVRY